MTMRLQGTTAAVTDGAVGMDRAITPTRALAGADIGAIFATNVKGTFHLTAALAPATARRGSGNVITITSMVAHLGISWRAAHGASNAAVDLLIKAWATEYGSAGVNVNAIAPGPARTERAKEQGRGVARQVVSDPALGLQPNESRESVDV